MVDDVFMADRAKIPGKGICLRIAQSAARGLRLALEEVVALLTTGQNASLSSVRQPRALSAAKSSQVQEEAHFLNSASETAGSIDVWWCRAAR